MAPSRSTIAKRRLNLSKAGRSEHMRKLAILKAQKMSFDERKAHALMMVKARKAKAI